MTAFWKAQIQFPYDSGIARDVSVNTFYFDSDEVGTQLEDAAIIAAVLSDWQIAVDELLSDEIGGVSRIKVFDMFSPKPRTPIFDVDGPPLVTAANALPNEVAVALSFNGDHEVGRRRERERGRIFFGPLGSGWMAAAVGDMRPGLPQRQILVDAAVTHLRDIEVTPGQSALRWCVFSHAHAMLDPVGGPYSPDPNPYDVIELTRGFIPVTNVWCDDSFDTMRSRGVRPSSRYTG